MDGNNNRNTLLLAFVLLLLGAMALIDNVGMVVMILIGLLFLVRQFDQQQLNAAISNSSYPDEDEWEEVETRPRQVQSEPVYRHALESVARAGLNPDEVKVLAVDVGTIAFTPNGEQQVFRTWSLPDDIDYLQPFVQLRVPMNADGMIKFEILDGNGETVFAHEDTHHLQRGRNFISPTARLPIHDERYMDGGWQLRVSADGVLLSVHQFEFAENTDEAIKRHIGEDGEINTELRAIMAESRLPKMSLDELLDYQDDEEEKRQRR